MIRNQLSPSYDEFYNWVTTGYKAQMNITRSKDRVVSTNEIFTSIEIVMYGLELAYPIEYFKDPTITYSDNCVGEGSWLVGMALLRMKHGLTHEDAIRNLRGVDIMIDNIDACRIRLMCKNNLLRDEVEKNIILWDKKYGGALGYSYIFKPMSETRRKREQRYRRKSEKAKEAKRIEEYKARVAKLFGDETSKPKSKKSSIPKETA